MLGSGHEATPDRDAYRTATCTFVPGGRGDAPRPAPHGAVVRGDVRPGCPLACDRSSCSCAGPDRLWVLEPVSRASTVPEYAVATLTALDAIGVGGFDLYGLHSGAAESIELATAHESRVRRVALTGILRVPDAGGRAAVCLTSSPEAQSPSRWRTVRTWRGVGSGGCGGVPRPLTRTCLRSNATSSTSCSARRTET